MIKQPDPTRWRNHLPIMGDLSLFTGNSNSARSGYVYLMFSPSYNLYKIGYTRSILQRLGALRIKHGKDLELIHWLPHYDARGVETHLHNSLAGWNIRKEWFEFLSSDSGLFLFQRMAQIHERLHQNRVQRVGVGNG